MTSLPQESDFPRYWDWDDDGLTADGVYEKTDRAPSQYGEKAILILEINGEQRSVWVNTESLRGKLADELERRNARDFNIGERIVITRAAEKKTSSNDRQYWPFKVDFPDGPKSDAAGLLGANPGGPKPDAGEATGDDGIPF
jgi:hypothetical protein